MVKGSSTKKWAKEEIDFLRENNETMTHEEMGKSLDRTVGAVQNKCNRVGIDFQKSWTNEEDDFLRLTHKSMTLNEMSEKLHSRTIWAINHRCFVLGLKREKQFPIQIGEVFGRLTVLNKTEKRTKSCNAYFLCECSCGVYKEVLGNSLRRGTTTSCGCYQKEVMKELRRLGIGESTYNTLEGKYKHGAQTRKGGLPYQLETEQFRSLVVLNCYWCGEEPKLKNIHLNQKMENITTASDEWAAQQWVLFNGIDRVNNDLGYTVDNCVPCCWDCNEFKKDKTPEEFLSHAERITNFQKNKKV